MNLEVAFHSFDTAKLPGQRKFHEVRTSRTTWVAVPDVAAESAPVALSITRPEGVPLEFRTMDGQFLRPFERSHGEATRRAGPVVDAVELTRTAASGTGPFNPFIIGVGTLWHNDRDYPWWNRRPLLDAEQAAHAEFETSNEAGAVALINRNAAGLVLVEGSLWVKSEEPLYVVGTETYEDHQAGILKAWVEIPGARDALKQIGRHFKLDDLVDVLSAVMPDGDWDADEPSTFRGRFRNVATVIDGASLRHAYDQYPALVAGLRSSVQAVQGRLADFTTPTIMLWTEMRDLLRAKAPGPALAATAGRLADALHGDYERDAAARIRKDLELWSLSPLAEAPATTFGPRP